MKKTLFIILAIIMVLALMPTVAFAAGTTWRVWDSAQLSNALTNSVAGDTIYLYDGAYALGQTTIDKDLTITGDSKEGVVINPTANTGSSGDARGWILVNSGVTLTLENLTLDGSGFNIYQAIRSNGSVIADNLIVCDMIYPTFYGHGMALMGSGNVIKNVTMHDIGRVGIGIYGTTTVQNFVYTAKGYGNLLDYGIEVGTTGSGMTPFTVNISDVTITGNRGVANGQWGSSGILISTYFYAAGGGTSNLVTVNINRANISNCSCAIDAGYTDDYYECSNTTVTNSNFFGNEYDLIFVGDPLSPATFTTTGNYYGGSAPVAWVDPGLVITGLNNYATSPVEMSQDTEVTAGVDPSYMIIIPAAVDFGMLVKDSGLQERNFLVEARDVVIENGYAIKVGVTSDFKMSDGATPPTTLDYSLFNVATDGTALTSGAQFASFNASGTHAGRVQVDTEDIEAAGSYKGTMMFTISYED